MRRTRAWVRPVALAATVAALALGPLTTATTAARATPTDPGGTGPTAGSTVTGATAGPTATGSTGSGSTATGPTAGSTATGSTGSAAATDAGTTEGLTVDITDIGPTVLGPDEPLEVRATVTNRTGTDATAPVAVLRVQRSTPISRSNLQRWLEPDSLFSTVQLARQELTAGLPAGSSATVTFTVPPEELPLGRTTGSWGPRGIEVEVDGGPGGAPAGADRSFVIWYPDLDVRPTPVGVLAPVGATAEELTAARGAGQSVASAASARVSPLLEALDQPGVTALVDPLLLADPGATGITLGDDAAAGAEPSAAASAVDPADDGTGTSTGDADRGTDPQVLRETLAALADGAGREVLVLPWADADVSALAHTDRTELIADAADRAAPLAAELGVRSDVVWPAEADQESVEAAADTGAAAVVLPDTALTPVAGLTYTASARAEVALGDGTVSAVLADEHASASLTGRLLPRVAAGSDEVTELDALTVRQYLLAQTAVVARERPSDPRPLVLALPRGYDGDAAHLGEVLAALADAPWVEPTTLTDLLDLDAPGLPRTELPTTIEGDGELGAAVLRDAATVEETAAALASITPDPQTLLEATATALTPVLSVAWRSDPAGRAGLVEHVEAELSSIGQAVTALPSSTVNLINASAQVPIHVRNDLAVDVVVQVVLEPSDPRLQAPEPVTITVPAGAEATAQVPVRAVGSGDLPVEVLLRTPTGEPFGVATELQVRARPDWENVGTGLAAGALALLLVGGIVRTARRGPRMDPSEPVPAPEDLG